MKKIASILLLALLAFNWFGYRWVSDWLQHKSDIHLEAKLDLNDYDESQLIELRVPLNIPYQANWTEYERYDGEVVVDGVHYKYVKRKVDGGELVLQCIPNQDRHQIENARDAFFKLVNDIQQPEKKSSSSHADMAKSLIGDCESSQVNTFDIVSTEISSDWNTYDAKLISYIYKLTPEQPPEA